MVTLRHTWSIHSIPIFIQYSVTFCDLLEVASALISGRFMSHIVFDGTVKLGYPELCHCRDILPEVVGYGIFDTL